MREDLCYATLLKSICLIFRANWTNNEQRTLKHFVTHFFPLIILFLWTLSSVKTLLIQRIVHATLFDFVAEPMCNCMAIKRQLTVWAMIFRKQSTVVSYFWGLHFFPKLNHTCLSFSNNFTFKHMKNKSSAFIVRSCSIARELWISKSKQRKRTEHQTSLRSFTLIFNSHCVIHIFEWDHRTRTIAITYRCDKHEPFEIRESSFSFNVLSECVILKNKTKIYKIKIRIIYLWSNVKMWM